MNPKYYICALNSSAPENEKVFSSFLDSKGFEYWHWINNFWILKVGTNYSARAIVEDLDRIFPKTNYFICAIVSTPEWFGRGPAGENSNMFTWLQENLMAEGQSLINLDEDSNSNFSKSALSLK